MNLSTVTVWKILKITLRKYPYKTKIVQSYTDQQKLCKVQFYNWILRQKEEFCNNIMWSDEKLWVKNPPNSLPELVNTVERYAASLNKDQIMLRKSYLVCDPCGRCLFVYVRLFYFNIMISIVAPWKLHFNTSTYFLCFLFYPSSFSEFTINHYRCE